MVRQAPLVERKTTRPPHLPCVAPRITPAQIDAPPMRRVMPMDVRDVWTVGKGTADAHSPD